MLKHRKRGKLGTKKKKDLTLLATERAVLRETDLATGGLAKDGAAGRADNDSLSVREDGGDVDAAGALYVHEETVGRLHEAL